MISSVFFLITGLTLLCFGAESLVKGSSKFALSLGIRPLIIGMTVVAFATSMPEMMVSLVAVIKGSSDLAAGNIIGSNIANIGLILGITALIAPLSVARKTLMRELPIVLVASSAVYLMSLDGQLGRLDGFVLVVGLFIFLSYCVFTSRNISSPSQKKHKEENPVAHQGQNLLYILIGIVGLGLGAELMVRSSVKIAHYFGISDLIIGITVIALGTSLPELAASAVSAWKGEPDLSVGNVLGSNIFNLLFVLGFCSLVQPIKIESGVLTYEFPIMLLFSFGLWFLIQRRLRLGRAEGILLLSAYLFFISWYLL